MVYTLITGSTSDIGKDIAVKLSSNANLVLLGRDLPELEFIKSKCKFPENHLVFVFDFNDIIDFREVFTEFLLKNAINIEGLVHCAGMMKVMHMKNVDLQNTYQIFNVNVFSITEIIAILLKKRVNNSKLKNIVFISSILANFGSTGHHLYSSTKAALNGLMHSLAIELAPAIRVNSISLGAVATKMSKELLSNKEVLFKLNNDYPLGIGTPKQISPFVNFLMSDDASWITGQEFTLDGGRTINVNNK